MPDVKELLIAELSKAKSVMSTLEEVEIMISLYKDELQSDINSMEMLIKRQEDKKFDQVNSALEFIMSDIMKYANKAKTIIADKKPITLIEDKANIKIKSADDDSLIKSGRVNNDYVAQSAIEILKRHPSTVYTTGEIGACLLSKHPELKQLWKNPSAAVNYVMSKVPADVVQKIGKGQYIVCKEAEKAGSIQGQTV